MKPPLIQLSVVILAVLTLPSLRTLAASRPGILVAISDDQSFPHTSAAGCTFVKTPAFDRVAKEGVMFRNAIAASPGCSPSRAALLIGRHAWQNEEAGTHDSLFPSKFPVYPELLERAGYHVGFTGKGWGPGNWKKSGRGRNPCGPEFSRRKNVPPTQSMNRNDYAGNFDDFLAAREDGQPFCFWHGATEPHRAYAKGSGVAAGKRIEDVVVPPFLPDTPEVREDLLDYALEIEWFDTHLGRMLAALEKAGELENTIVIVTADNGMPFPRAKANGYEYGVHVPLAIRWRSRVPGGRTIEDVVGFVDLTATILDAAGVTQPAEFPLMGRSLLPMLTENAGGSIEPGRAAFSSRERHSSSRYNNWTYPQRVLRTGRHLFIRNFKPGRWPAGDPQLEGGPMHGAYYDIDASPTLDYLAGHRDEEKVGRLFQLAVGKRPAEELFDIQADPNCLRDLSGDPAHADVKREMAARLESVLRETGDPRIAGDGEIWESYPRNSAVRKFPPPGDAP